MFFTGLHEEQFTACFVADTISRSSSRLLQIPAMIFDSADLILQRNIKNQMDKKSLSSFKES
jgi:hypothetical protein